MRRSVRHLLALVLGTALVATPLALVTAPAHAAPAPSGGTVVAWGEGSLGGVPVSLRGATVVAVDAGSMHSLALTADGAVTAWGDDSQGQTDVPASAAASRITAISAGDYHSLALTDAGTVIAWGLAGDGRTTVPASLTGKRVTAVSAGYAHSLALTDDGTVTAWGAAGGGATAVPASLSGKRVVAISAGTYHSLALTDDGAVTAWGDNAYGQTTLPASLAGQRVVKISAGSMHSLALTDDGAVIAWGYNSYGQIDVPASLAGQRVTTIAAGTYHSLAVTDDGRITGWGFDGHGQATAPGAAADKRATTVAGGFVHSLAIVNDPPAVDTGVPGDVALVTAGAGVPLSVATPGATLSSFTVTALDGGRVERSGDLVAVFPPTQVGTYRFRVLAQTDEGELENTVTVLVRAGAVDRLGVAGPTAAHHGDTVGLTVSGFDRFDNPTGDETGRVTVTSSDPADTVSGADVTVGSAGPRTLTVTHTPTGVTATRVVTVSLNAFATAPAPGISGTVKVGETLTAETGAVVPTPDALSYQWLADGRTITGATGTTFTPDAQHTGRRISVRATAVRTGYADASATSAETAPVAGSAAPSPVVDLDASRDRLRRGQPTTLSWTSTDADHVTASGAWTGTKPAAGRATVEPGLGTSVYRLTARNAAGTTTTQVSVTVTRPAARLAVGTTSKPVVRGTRTRVNVRGLDAREPYSVTVAGRTVARGTADTRGRVSRSVTVPRLRPTDRATVTVTGSLRDRTGRDSLAVVTGTLTATAKKSHARASTDQRVTVRGLVPGQKVRVTYRGKRVSTASARASRAGTYVVRFDVGQRWGTKKITVRAGDRSARASFAVVPRRG